MRSPIEYLGCYDNKNEFYIKREDLLPFSFGGNKIRIAKEYLDDMIANGKDCIIGYGGTQSNLCRAIANLSVSERYLPFVKECIIVSPIEKEGEHSFNSAIVSECQVKVVKCNKSNVSQTIQTVLDDCKTRGLNPYYINGDKYGHGNEAISTKSGVAIFNEIKDWSNHNKIVFDYIFLAVGTGMTYAGLLCGQAKYKNSSEKIIGISIAREAVKEIPVVIRYSESYFNKFNSPKIDTDNICIDDNYLCGGYGKYCTDEIQVIRTVLQKYGLPLDVTYTGKAFYGMMQYLNKESIKGKNILFLHTGGTPLFFDTLKLLTSENITEKVSRQSLIDFLVYIDKSLPVPLTQRVNLSEYADKVLQNGNVYSIVKEEKIVAAVLFYCNDFNSKRAYISMVGTLADYSGRGYATQLLEKVIEKCKSVGMEFCCMETDLSNCRALRLYLSLGFVIEYVDTKIHLIKEL